MRFKLEGIIAATLTPFTKNGEYVDFDKVGALVDRLVRKGIHGFFVCGTTGEASLCTTDERMAIVEEAVNAAGKRAPIIVQTGGIDTATTIELTRHAQKAGARAAAIVAPGFYGYDDLALAKYYKDIAAAVPSFPIMLYNIPGCAKNALSPDLVLRLADEVENIVGIKDSSGNMPQLTRLLGHAPKGFAVVNGCDEMGYQALLAGGPAVVSGTANVVPELYLAVYNNIQKGKLKQAWDAQVKLTDACRVLEYGSKLSVFKEALRQRGFDAGYVRPPQRELTPQEKNALAKALASMELL